MYIGTVILCCLWCYLYICIIYNIISKIIGHKCIHTTPQIRRYAWPKEDDQYSCYCCKKDEFDQLETLADDETRTNTPMPSSATSPSSDAGTKTFDVESADVVPTEQTNIVETSNQ